MSIQIDPAAWVPAQQAAAAIRARGPALTAEIRGAIPAHRVWAAIGDCQATLALHAEAIGLLMDAAIPAAAAVPPAPAPAP